MIYWVLAIHGAPTAHVKFRMGDGSADVETTDDEGVPVEQVYQPRCVALVLFLVVPFLKYVGSLGAPGGVMGEGLRRIDWLMQTTHFGGLVEDRAVLDARVGHGIERAQPATFVLEVNSGPRKDDED